MVESKSLEGFGCNKCTKFYRYSELAKTELKIENSDNKKQEQHPKQPSSFKLSRIVKDIGEQIDDDLLEKNRRSHLDLDSYDEESDYKPYFGDD